MLTQFQQSLEIEQAAGQMGVAAARTDFGKARDDAIRGTGAPAKWRKTDAQLAQEAQAAAMKQQIAGAVQEASAGAQVAGQVADASQKIGQAMQPPEQQQQLPAPAQQKRLAPPAPQPQVAA